METKNSNAKKTFQVSSREVNGRLVLEGVLTIYWGTETTVRLAETVDNRVIARQRKTQSLYLDTRFHR